MNINRQIRYWASLINENEIFKESYIENAYRYNEEKKKIFSQMIQKYAEKNGYIFGYDTSINKSAKGFEKFADAEKEMFRKACDYFEYRFDDGEDYYDSEDHVHLTSRELAYEHAEDYITEQENEFLEMFDKFKDGKDEVDFLEFARYFDKDETIGTKGKDEKICVFYLSDIEIFIYMYRK